MAPTPQFRRLILGLAIGHVDEGLLEASAELASLLGGSIHGVFIDDQNLRHLSFLSRLREFDLLRRKWRPLEETRVVEEVQLLARAAKRRLDKISSQWGIMGFFEVLREEDVREFLHQAHPSDIIVAWARKSPSERLGSLVPQISAAFAQNRLTTLFLPNRMARHEGPVVALASPRGDAGLRVAAAIAKATKERLVLVVPTTDHHGHARVCEAAQTIGLARNRIELVSLLRIETHNFLAVINHVAERIVILPSMGNGGNERVDPSIISSTRSIPVMLVDPTAAFEHQ